MEMVCTEQCHYNAEWCMDRDLQCAALADGRRAPAHTVPLFGSSLHRFPAPRCGVRPQFNRDRGGERVGEVGGINRSSRERFRIFLGRCSGPPRRPPESRIFSGR